MRKERYPLEHLLLYWEMPVTIGRVECLVIAIGTPAPPHLSVTVGTGKTAVKRNLLHLAAKHSTQVCTELIIIKNIFAHNWRR